MEERTLFKIAAAISILGLFIMYTISEKMDLSNSNISMINRTLIGEKIHIKGTIMYKNDFGKIILLNVTDDTGSMQVVMYKNSKNVNINKGDIIEVTGLVNDYNGRLEIKADKIKK